MISTDLTTRQIQLNFFDGQFVIKQDQELIDLINQHKYTTALGVGDVGYFKKYINLVDSGQTDFCIYIQVFKFNFNDLVDHINYIAKKNLKPGALMYLSLNKYMAEPGRYDTSLPIDYDLAIKQFITQRVNLLVETYQPCGLDLGQKFNWVHPLTRFYLRKSI